MDVEQIRDYLDEVRAALPGELRQAQQIVNDRAQIVDSANAQAQAIVKKAEERARILVSDAEIVKEDPDSDNPWNKPTDVAPEPKPEPKPEPEPEPEPDPEPGEAPGTGSDTQPDPAPGGENVGGE